MTSPFAPDCGDEFRYVPPPAPEAQTFDDPIDDPVDDPIDDPIGDALEEAYEAAWRDGRITRDSEEARAWRHLRANRYDDLS
ncbi:hypothetical protein ACFVVA_40200 [Kitasatospora sp. NPDC058048]|uniref:hypothetical protein n=1 Tax=Kitasatospora sp. NPDC058048 TaxID=3346313 RepID=UPI0036DE19FE